MFHKLNLKAKYFVKKINLFVKYLTKILILLHPKILRSKNKIKVRF